MEVTERYVNAPLKQNVYAALKEQAVENGRNPGRELAQIAEKALARKTKKGGKA